MRIVRVFFLLLFLLSSSTFAVAQSQNPNFLLGVAQFEAQDYRAAQQSFKQAAHESPGNVPINLWLGLSHTALDDGWTSDDIWRAGIGDENWEAAV